MPSKAPNQRRKINRDCRILASNFKSNKNSLAFQSRSIGIENEGIKSGSGSPVYLPTGTVLHFAVLLF